MSTIRAEIRRRGYYQSATRLIVGEFFIHISLMLIGVFVFLESTNIFIQVVGVLMTVLGNIGIASNSHTATHNATYKSVLANKIHSIIGGPLLLGLSATYWHHKHVVLHHRAPNVVGIDKDIDLSPLFLIMEPQRKAARGWKKYWYNSQWIFFPFMVGFAAIGMNFNGWVYLVQRILDRRGIRWIHVVDVLTLILNILLWIALARYSGFPEEKILQLFAARSILLGYAFFAVLAPAHYPEAARSYTNTRENLKDNVRLVTHSTLNFRSASWSNFFLSGLQYQIEHHLFPDVSHHYYPKLSQLMKEYCQEHGYPYQEISWFEGIVKSCVTFIKPKNVHQKILAAKQ